MRNYRIELEFDGTEFHGWQRQPERRTVQAAVERAIAQTVGHPVDVMGCSRTDAGVHALGYVANFKADSELPAERMRLAISSRLPADVVVKGCEIALDEFDACSNALAKIYRYTTVHGTIRPAVERAFVNYCPYALTFAPMKEGARHLVGKQDFAAFVNQLEPGKDTVRTIYAVEMGEEGNRITMTFVGEGFMYNMVRIIAGTLIEVGRGVREPTWVADTVAARDRRLAGPTAPAKGLTLTRVVYERGELEGLIGARGAGER